MTPVFQTKYGKDQGNCLTACVASVLDVPIESVPEFCVDGEWFTKLAAFCEDNGFALLYWRHAKDVEALCININVIVLLSLEGENDLHAVVGKTSVSERIRMPDGSTRWEWKVEMVHDPNERGYPPVVGPVGYILIAKQ